MTEEIFHSKFSGRKIWGHENPNSSLSNRITATVVTEGIEITLSPREVKRKELKQFSLMKRIRSKGSKDRDSERNQENQRSLQKKVHTPAALQSSSRTLETTVEDNDTALDVAAKESVDNNRESAAISMKRVTSDKSIVGDCQENCLSNQDNLRASDSWTSWSYGVILKSDLSAIGASDLAAVEESLPRLERQDFQHSTWLEVISRGSYSTYGIAAVMTATVIIHPLLFMAGVVWVVGLFHAIDKGYEYFSDGNFSELFWKNGDDTTTVLHGDEPAQTVTDPVLSEKEENFNEPSIHQTATLANTAPTTDLSLEHLLSLHFPPLETKLLVDIKFSGLNALEFFEVFFSDNAPFTMKEFQERRGDIDVVYSLWENSTGLEKSSFHPKAAAIKDLPLLPSVSRKKRTINFKPLTKSYFGPAYAVAKKDMIVTKLSKHTIIIECETRLFDIPFSDRFLVIERWVFDSVHEKDGVDNNSNTPILDRTTRLDVSAEVFMLKECTWENQIRQKSLSTMSIQLSDWHEAATQAIEKTVQKKLFDLSVEQKLETEVDSNQDNALAIDSKTENTNQTLMEFHQAKFKELEQKLLCNNPCDCFSSGKSNSAADGEECVSIFEKWGIGPHNATKEFHS